LLDFPTDGRIAGPNGGFLAIPDHLTTHRLSRAQSDAGGECYVHLPTSWTLPAAVRRVLQRAHGE